MNPIALLGLALALITATWTGSARALSCERLEDSFEWTPEAGSTSPRNVHPRLLRRTADDHVVEAPEYDVSDVLLACVEAGRAEVVRTTHERRSGYRYESFEWIPERPLPADSECAVVRGNAVLSWFRTSRELDETPPSALGMRSAIVHRCTNAWDPCPEGSARAELEFVGVDDDTTRGQLLVEVFVTSGDASAFEPEGAPFAVLTRPELGTTDLCDLAGNFAFPPLGERRRVDFVLVDFAGRRSTPIETLLEGPPTPFQAFALRDADELLRSGRIAPLRGIEEERVAFRTWVLVGLAVLLVLVVGWHWFAEMRD